MKMFPDLNVLDVRATELLTMTTKVFLTTSLVLHLSIFTGHSHAFMRLNVRAAATSHSVVAITNSYSYVKLESCPSSGPLNSSCNDNYKAVKARFGPPVSKDLVARFEMVNPPDACEDISFTQGASRKSSTYIAVVNNNNCSFEIKVTNAEKAGYIAVIIYANKEDKDLLNMSSSSPSLKVSIPSFYVSHDTGTKLALYSSKLLNTSRPSMLVIATRRKFLSSQPNFTGKVGAINANGAEEEDGDNFGEHYFHICIYIWACVVVSSLIGLSVKWGCCGRSLTRWEVTKIPLKRFRRNSGSDYQDKCPICHEEFHEGRLIRQLPCNHCYHSYCVDRWLVKMSNRCPLCKQRVSVSLFCSWSKQRDGRGGLQHSDADLDAEEASVVGDLPPLPPVQSLTPSTLYGDVIMSGPSKFILMRPGKATRVIEVPKKESNPQTIQQDGYQHLHQQQQQQQKTRAIVSTPIPSTSDKRDKKTQKSSLGDKKAALLLSSSLSSSSSFHSKSNKSVDKNDDTVAGGNGVGRFTVDSNGGDVIYMEMLCNAHRQDSQPHHHYPIQNSPPHKSSRSSSITSEHPLLTEEDRGSVFSLHSITGCIVGQEEQQPLRSNNSATDFPTPSPYGREEEDESRCIFDNVNSSCVGDSGSIRNQKMDTSDSSDYGCNCDFIEEEERVLSREKIVDVSRRWEDASGGGEGRLRDSHYRSRDDKSVILEVNVNLSPKLFHAKVEQHCGNVQHCPPQTEEQLKGGGCDVSLSSPDVCGSNDHALNVLGDSAVADVSLSVSAMCVNNCKNVDGFGRNNSNTGDGKGCCQSVHGGISDGSKICDGGGTRRGSKLVMSDGNRGGRMEVDCGGRMEVDRGGREKVDRDGREKVDRGGSAIYSLLQQSAITTGGGATASAVSKKKTKVTPAALDANRMCNSYPPSLRQIVATWDSSLRRGRSKTTRSRSYCPSSPPQNNGQTL